MEFVLTPDQLFVLTWVAQGLVQLLKIIAGLIKRPIADHYKLLIVFVVSGGLAYFWADVDWPSLDNPAEFIGSLFANIGIVMVAAAVIYEKLSGPVLGWIDDKILAKIPGVKKLVPLLRP